MRLLLPLLTLLVTGTASAAEPVTRGVVPVAVAGDEKAGVPPEYRLPDESFAFESRLKYDLKYSGVEVVAVTFPTALPSAFAVNNTVYCEYFRPKGVTKPGPAVIVLDILDGAGVVSRGQAMWLAVHGVPAVCMTMPYYGPRRPDERTDGKQRFLSMDVPGSLEHIRQCVLDARRAVAWLAVSPKSIRRGWGYSARAWAASWAASSPRRSRAWPASACCWGAADSSKPSRTTRRARRCSRRCRSSACRRRRSKGSSPAWTPSRMPSS